MIPREKVSRKRGIKNFPFSRKPSLKIYQAPGQFLTKHIRRILSKASSKISLHVSDLFLHVEQFPVNCFFFLFFHMSRASEIQRLDKFPNKNFLANETSNEQIQQYILYRRVRHTLNINNTRKIQLARGHLRTR